MSRQGSDHERAYPEALEKAKKDLAGRTHLELKMAQVLWRKRYAESPTTEASAHCEVVWALLNKKRK